jgi:hypothetical protein
MTQRMLWVVVTLIVAGFAEQALDVVGFLHPMKQFPIHEEWFGPNKTWRLPALLPALCAMVAAASTCSFGVPSWVDAAALGAGLGVAWVLGELPNSYVKRRLGLAPGTQMAGAAGAVQWLVDHLDSCTGVALYLMLWQGWPAAEVLPILPVAVLAHGAHNAICHYVVANPRP